MKNEQFTPGRAYSKHNQFHLEFDFDPDTTIEEVEIIKSKMLAAPDMYEALRRLTNFISENKIRVGKYGILNEDLDFFTAQAKAALSKANPQSV